MRPESRAVEIAIVGAGPAGMAAAVRLAKAGHCPVVFDMNATPGGQIYRQLSAPQVSDTVMGKDYMHGRELIDAFQQADIDYRPGSRVWWADSDASGTSLGVLEKGRAQHWQAKQLILAGGAMERGWPFRGWQLPGVMNAGAAQILLKQGALIPSSSPVLAGTGPLLYLLAWQYLRAGTPPSLILDTAPVSRYTDVLSQVRRAWLGRSYLLKGVRMIAALKRAGVPIRQGITALEAEGKEAVESIGYRHRGQWKTHSTELLLTHFGVTPEPQLARSLGLEHAWHASQQSFVPRRDDNLAAGTNVWIAGDGGGIGGAINAEREGQLAALTLLEQIGEANPEWQQEQHALRNARWRDLEARSLLESMFRLPEDWLDGQPEETLVCRCESVSRGELDLAIAQGGAGPNQLKAFTRCGMGPCQGRQCGESVTRLLARRLDWSPDAVGYYHIRPPVHSITLGELAAKE